MVTIKNNDIDNTELLCPNCHRMTDNFGFKGKTHKKLADKHKINVLGSEPRKEGELPSSVANIGD